ncbi:MAG: MarR family winged helix-turn-helix transcriptional regulator [Christensenellales bacterium]
MENRYNKFTLLISVINRSINKIKSEEMSKFGLKSYHVSCLFYLYKNLDCGLTASELCALCEEDKGTISRSLNYLENYGYIICKEDNSKKKYRAKLHLTQQGRKIAQKITQITDEAVEKGSCGITEEERVIMYKSLDIISDNLKKICEKYGDENGN